MIRNEFLQELPDDERFPLTTAWIIDQLEEERFQVYRGSLDDRNLAETGNNIQFDDSAETTDYICHFTEIAHRMGLDGYGA